jgi:tetratricopeptide (TPR) repeat protein
MVTFGRTLRNDRLGVAVHHSISYDGELPDRNIPPRKSSKFHILRFEVPEEYLPVMVDFETLNGTAVAPLGARLTSDLSSQELELEIQVPPESPVTFRTLLTSIPKDKRVQSFEVEAPPPRLLDWAASLLRRTYTNDIFADIRDHLGTNDETQAIVEFIKQTRAYLSSDQLLRLLDICAETSVEFREHIDSIFTPTSFARYLPGGHDTMYLELESWSHVRQFCASSAQLRYVPTISETDLVREGITLASNASYNNADTKLNRLWKLEESLDISMRYPETLTFRKVVGLVSRATLEGRREVVKNLLQYRLDPIEFDDLEGEVESTKYDGERSWEELLYAASVHGGRLFEVVLANFLRETAENRDVSILYSTIAYEAAAKLFTQLGRQNFAQSSAFQEHYLRGRLLLNTNRFDAASTEFLQARLLSLNEIQARGNTKYTNLEGSWVYLYEARMEHLRELREFDAAVETIEEGVRSAELFQDFSNDNSRRWVEHRIRAMLAEVKGDRALSVDDFEEAEACYGTAIHELQSVNQNFDKSITYLKNRCSGIKAAFAEAAGDYERAANLYKSIEDETDYENVFVKFHRTRMFLCQVRDAIARRELTEARKCLERITYESGSLEAERMAIEFLLDVIDSYENGEETDIDESLQVMQRIAASADDAKAEDFGYGQDFRPAIIQILGAQRTKNIVGAKDILDHLVDVAIEDALKPNSVKELIDQKGIDRVGNTDHWKGRVPDFITRQLQEVVRKASGNRSTDNYKSQTEGLTGILEECTGIFVTYYAQRKHGEEWKENMTQSGMVTLGDIENNLHRELFDDFSRIGEVRKLFSSTEFADVVLSNKEGTIIDVRNDLDHNNKSFVSKAEYDRVKSHVESIISALSQDMPILGVVGEQNKYGAYSIETLRLNPIEQAEIITDKPLEQNRIYFFPPTITNDGNLHVENETILPCISEYIVESITTHSKASFDPW